MGKVSGEVITKHLVVQGTVDGSIDAARVEIKEGGRVKGMITSEEFVIESKGLFEGESKIKSHLNNDVKKEPKAKESTAQEA